MKSLPELLASALRELALRKRVYPRWIEAGRISEEQAAHEIACMEDICRIINKVKLLAEVSDEIRGSATHSVEVSTPEEKNP